MNATECFKDHQSRAFDKLIEISVDEKVVEDDILAFVQLQTSTFEVEVDVQVLQELGDWVLVGIRFLLDDFDQVLECVATTTVDDDGDREVAQDVRTGGLNNIQVHRLVQQHFDDQIATFRVMEEHEHAPVDQPSALCQQLHVAEAAVVDELAQTVQVLQSRLPVERQNLGCQLAPQDIQVVLVVGLHDHQADVQVRRCLGVVTAIVHVLGELVNALNDVDVDLKVHVSR